MIYTLKFVGGPSDGISMESEYSPPEMIDASNTNTFFYLGPNYYILSMVDHENKVAYYDQIAMAEYPDAVQVEEGVWAIKEDPYAGPPS